MSIEASMSFLRFSISDAMNRFGCILKRIDPVTHHFPCAWLPIRCNFCVVVFYESDFCCPCTFVMVQTGEQCAAMEAAGLSILIMSNESMG